MLAISTNEKTGSKIGGCGSFYMEVNVTNKQHNTYGKASIEAAEST